jgi:thymidine kinase
MGIVGYAGAGKTFALIDIFNKNENVFYVAATETMSAKTMFCNLLEQFNIKPDLNENLNKIIERIALQLNSDSKKKLIIIDECTYLKTKMLSFLKELSDKTIGTTGYVLAGPFNYTEELEKWARQNVKGVGEFLSRIWGFQELDLPKANEIDAFLKHNEIKDRKFAARLKKEIKSFRKLVQEIEKYKFEQENEDLTGVLVT